MNVKQCSSMNSYNSLAEPLKNKQTQQLLKNKRIQTFLIAWNIWVKVFKSGPSKICGRVSKKF